MLGGLLLCAVAAAGISLNFTLLRLTGEANDPVGKLSPRAVFLEQATDRTPTTTDTTQTTTDTTDDDPRRRRNPWSPTTAATGATMGRKRTTMTSGHSAGGRVGSPIR